MRARGLRSDQYAPIDIEHLSTARRDGDEERHAAGHEQNPGDDNDQKWDELCALWSHDAAPCSDFRP